MINGAPSATQMSPSWHEGGLFVGMHWLWWFVWVLTLLVLGWAFVRLYVDRSETRRAARREEAAEEEARRRFAAGEIDEKELARRIEILRQTYIGR